MPESQRQQPRRIRSLGSRETQKSFLLVRRGGWRPPCHSEGSLIFSVISVRILVYSLSYTSNSFPRVGASPVHKFSNEIRSEGSPGVNPSTSPASAICIPEDMSYLVNQRIPNALVESLSGSVTSVPSFKNLPGVGLPPGVLSTESKSRSVLGLGSAYVSGPSSASPVSSRPRSGSSGSSLTMEIPENILLCEESLADLDAVCGSWC